MSTNKLWVVRIKTALITSKCLHLLNIWERTFGMLASEKNSTNVASGYESFSFWHERKKGKGIPRVSTVSWKNLDEFFWLEIFPTRSYFQRKNQVGLLYNVTDISVGFEWLKLILNQPAVRGRHLSSWNTGKDGTIAPCEGQVHLNSRTTQLRDETPSGLSWWLQFLLFLCVDSFCLPCRLAPYTWQEMLPVLPEFYILHCCLSEVMTFMASLVKSLKLSRKDSAVSDCRHYQSLDNFMFFGGW